MAEPHPASDDTGWLDEDRTASLEEAAQVRQDQNGADLAGDHLEVTLWLALRWEPALAAFLPLLSQDSLVGMLKEADARFLKQSLQALGLAKKWQRLQPRLNPRALAVIAADVSRVLNDAGRAKFRGIPASKIVFTWWARKATLLFAGTKLGAKLAQVPLPYRLAHAIEWLRANADGAETSRHTEQLGPLRASQNHLDQVFAVIYDAGLEGISEADLSARLALTVSPQPSVPRPDPQVDRRSPNELASESPRIVAATERRRVPQPNVAVADEVRSDSALPGPATTVETARAALAKCRQASEQMKAAADHGELAGVTEAYEALKGARQSAEATLETFGSLIRQAGLKPPDLDDAIFANEAAATSYLNQLEIELAGVERRAFHRIEAARDELTRKFISLDLPIPEPLRTATSVAELATVQNQWQPEFVAIRLLKQLSTWPEMPPRAFAELSADRRLDLYEKLLAMPASEIASERLLRWIVTDRTALKTSADRGPDLLTKAIINSLDYVVPLPSGVWSIYRELAGPRCAEALLSSGLAAAVAGAPEKLIDLESLAQLADLDSGQLPQPLRIALKRRRLLDTGTDDTIPLLGELALEAEMDGATLDALVTALIRNNRHSEAVALAILAERANRYTCDRRDVLLAFAQVLLEAVERDESGRTLVCAVLEQGDVDWLAELPDGVVVLLYLIAKTHSVRPWTELRYQSLDLLLAASKRRPALAERWLGGMSESPAIERQQRAAVAAEAADVLREFEHGMKRTSVYTAWPPAIEYQKYFNQTLTRAFLAIESGFSYSLPSPDEIIQAAVSKGCAVAEGKVKQRMLEYLSTQLNRLQQIENAKAVLGLDTGIGEILAREAVPLRDALIAESKDVPRGSPIAWIYARAIEES